MRLQKYWQHGLIGATAAIVGAAQLVPGTDQRGPVTAAAASFVAPKQADAAVPSAGEEGVLAMAHEALAAFSSRVQGLSHPKALETAFRSYFAYKTEHPEKVTKPYLYFVDYGQPNTAKRGYVFDMETMRIVDGPFTVAAGRGSAERNGLPTRFSNQHGSAATSLGLYLAQETYAFSGKAMGRFYRSVGLRLQGLSGEYNDNARTRGVVAHGAPYVTAKRAGRSEGCPAMEEPRAQRLLPKIANGGMVFLFAPEQSWMNEDPWIVASAE